MAKIARNDKFHRTADQWEMQIEGLIETALKEKRITKADAAKVRGFVTFKTGLNVELNSIYNSVQMVLLWRKFMPVEFGKASIDDITAAKVAMERSEQYALSYQKLIVVVVKGFFRYGLREKSKWAVVTEQQLKDEFKPVKVLAKSKNVEDIMTAAEIVRLIDAADNSRDRAMLAVQYEAGLRAVDIGRLTWGDLTVISEKETSIVVENKTIYERRISIVLYNSYLNQWKRDAKNSNDKNGFVFLTHSSNLEGEQITYDVVSKVVKKCVERAGITGRMATPHTLRHSRITYWLQHNVSIPMICKMAWGVVYSPMIKTYEHLGNDEAAKEQRRIAGIVESERFLSGELRFNNCPHCGHDVPPGNKGHCENCGGALTEEAAKEAATRKDTSAVIAEMEERFNKRAEAIEAKYMAMMEKLMANK